MILERIPPAAMAEKARLARLSSHRLAKNQAGDKRFPSRRGVACFVFPSKSLERLVHRFGHGAAHRGANAQAQFQLHGLHRPVEKLVRARF